jgi:exonuclease VII small subunit
MRIVIKKEIIASILALIVFSFGTVALAEETTENATNTERNGEAVEGREVRQELREERQTTLQEIRQQRIINLAANLSNRLEAAISRFYNIVGRLEQRINKLKSAGINTAEAEGRLREAAQNLAAARATLKDIDLKVTAATASSQPQADWKEVRETYLATAALVRLSHQQLRETVALLKATTADTNQNPSQAVSSSSEANTESEQ